MTEYQKVNLQFDNLNHLRDSKVIKQLSLEQYFSLVFSSTSFNVCIEGRFTNLNENYYFDSDIIINNKY